MILIIYLAIMHNSKRAEAWWFIQNEVRSFTKHYLIKSFSISIIHSTCPLAFVLQMVMWWWTMLSSLQRHLKLPAYSVPLSGYL